MMKKLYSEILFKVTGNDPIILKESHQVISFVTPPSIMTAW
jgi:hypothetical protein